MSEIIASKNKQGIKLQYDNSFVLLQDDKRIRYGHNESWGSMDFDLYSEVGELWRMDIDYILAQYDIVISKLDTAEVYCDVWVSHSCHFFIGA